MRKIIFMSRLDADCSLGAYLLCNVAQEINEKIPDLQIIIVGGGTEYKNIRKIATKINKNINRELIIAVGEVDDPQLYLEGGSLFVGVSRAALEAMAHGLPVILLGNEGYLGLLDKTKLDAAQKTNFTCRSSSNSGQAEVSRDDLLNEICRYFDLSSKEKEEISKLSVETVREKYSARAMAEKTLDFYSKTISNYQQSKGTAPHRPKKIAICGYYGRGNLGDETILSVLKNKINRISQGSQIFVVGSKNPLKSIFALTGADVFIFGGGSLLQNATSSASLFYYLSMIFLAKIFVKRRIMLSNGIGPLVCGAALKSLLIKAINSFDCISARDNASKKHLEELLPRREIHYIPDPAFALSQFDGSDLQKGEGRQNFIYIPCSGGLKRSGVSPFHVSSALKQIQRETGLSPLLVILNPSDDLEIAQKISAQLKNAKIVRPKNALELRKIMSSAAFVISERYHGALFGALSGINTLVISGDPKSRALCRELGLFPCQKYETYFQEDAIFGAISRLSPYYSGAESKIKANIEKSIALTNEKTEELLRKYILPS